MAETLKVLGQASLSAAVLTDVYTVPTGAQAVISTFTMCNRSSTANSSFRISVASGGAVDDNKQYIYYDVAIIPNETFASTIGLSLTAGDVLRGYASDGNLSFNIFGEEIR